MTGVCDAGSGLVISSLISLLMDSDHRAGASLLPAFQCGRSSALANAVTSRLKNSLNLAAALGSYGCPRSSDDSLLDGCGVRVDLNRLRRDTESRRTVVTSDSLPSPILASPPSRQRWFWAALALPLIMLAVAENRAVLSAVQAQDKPHNSDDK